MNPWALLAILLGIVLIVIGIKGTQHNITGVITGKPPQDSQQPSGTTPSTRPSAPKPPPTRTVPPVAPM